MKYKNLLNAQESFLRFVFGKLFIIVSLGHTIAYAITNGQKVSESSTPQVVKVEAQGDVCTGVVVGVGLVLTAEHCLGFKRIGDIKVSGYPIKDFFVPEAEDYYTQSRLDLALLSVDSRLTPAILPIRSIALPNQSIAVSLMGYGDSYKAGQRLVVNRASIKRLGHNILPLGHSSRNEFYYIIRSEISPQNPNSSSGTLPGDSGGPLIYDNSVIGIASTSVYGFSTFVNLSGSRSQKFFKDAFHQKRWRVQFKR